MVTETSTDETFEVLPLTTDTWPLFAGLVERHNGIFSGCWCVKFHPEREDRLGGYDGNRAFKQCLVDEGVAHAALVVHEGEDGPEAIAWAEYGTPAELPDLHHRKQYDAEKERDPDYRITCVFIDRRFRRQGISEIAIRGALDLIARAGGGVVESYPHDLTEQTKKMSSSFLYNSTRRLYERLGFDYVRPKGLKNCVMSLDVPATR